MANVVISPNMNLPVPVPTVDPGPDYAFNENLCFNAIDSHNHTPGMGVQIPVGGLDINGDLEFNDNNATLLRSVRFESQSAVLTDPSDLGCLYEVDDDLYFNDGAGNNVRITQSGAVAGTPGSIANLVSPASASYVGGSATFVWESNTSVAANMDAGTLIVRYPGSYPTPSGNYIALQAPSALATGYALTLPALPVATNFVTLDTSGNFAATANVDGTTIQFTSDTLSVKNLGIGTAQLANLSVTSGKIATDAVTTVKILDQNVTPAKIVTDVNLNGTSVKADSRGILVSQSTRAADSYLPGRVTSTGTVDAPSPAGYTVSHPSTGNYTVTISPAFSDIIGVTGNVDGNTGYAFNLQIISDSVFNVAIRDSAGVAQNAAFCFTASGRI